MEKIKLFFVALWESIKMLLTCKDTELHEALALNNQYKEWNNKLIVINSDLMHTNEELKERNNLLTTLAEEQNKQIAAYKEQIEVMKKIIEKQKEMLIDYAQVVKQYDKIINEKKSNTEIKNEKVEDVCIKEKTGFSTFDELQEYITFAETDEKRDILCALKVNHTFAQLAAQLGCPMYKLQMYYSKHNVKQSDVDLYVKENNIRLLAQQERLDISNIIKLPQTYDALCDFMHSNEHTVDEKRDILCALRVNRTYKEIIILLKCPKVWELVGFCTKFNVRTSDVEEFKKRVLKK